jgi:hypothetical protein
MKEEIKAYNNVLELIGSTPLIKLNRITADFPGNFYAKVEAFNPGHSSKDRIALYIIEQAEKKESFLQVIQSLRLLRVTPDLVWRWLVSLKGIIAYLPLLLNLPKIK